MNLNGIFGAKINSIRWRFFTTCENFEMLRKQFFVNENAAKFIQINNDNDINNFSVTVYVIMRMMQCGEYAWG